MKLSVITINYNNCEGLSKTIQSVVNQTWKEFEYIIIDGGSTDGSVDVIKKYADKITYWVSEPDKGIYHAMNKGIDVAKGEYCLFLNSGDSLFDKRTFSEVSVELNGADVITGTLMLDSGTFCLSPTEVTIPYLYKDCGSLSHPSSFIKSHLLKKYHYDEELKIVSDWKFFIQVLIMDGVSYKSISQIISIFDCTGISSNSEMLLKERHYVLENDFPKSIYTYFLDNTKDYDSQLYLILKNSKFRKFFYTFNILLMKIISFFFGKKGVKNFPLKL